MNLEQYQRPKIDKEVEGCDRYEVDRVARTKSKVNGSMHIDLWSLGMIVGDGRSTVRSISADCWSN